MKKIYLSILSFLLISILSTVSTISTLAAQEFRLFTEKELDLPTRNPYGLTWHNDHFWVSDVEDGTIYRIHKEREDLCVRVRGVSPYEPEGHVCC